MQPIELIVAGFEGFNSADQAAQELRSMDHEDRISLLNTVVIKKDARGHVQAEEDNDVSAGGGALFGALVGAIIGFLGGPGGAVVGAAAGAITGGITAAGVNFGIDQLTLDEMKSTLRPNTSAILALVEQEWVEKFTHEINARRGYVIRTTLREDLIKRMRKERNKD